MLYWSIEPNTPVPATLPLYNEIAVIYSQQSDSVKIHAEINAKFRSTVTQPKPGYINAGERDTGKKGGYWLSGGFTLDCIKTLISKGFIFRFGVKNCGTNYKQHFESQQIFFLDFDCGQTIEESKSKFSDTAFLIYRTPSYTPENQKHRVLFCLDTPIQNEWMRSSAVFKFLLNKNLNADQSCSDPSRIAYPTIDQSNGIEFFNPDNRLEGLLADKEYQSILKLIEQPEVVYNPESKYHAPLIRCLEKDFNWDINAFLFTLGLEFDFNFKEINADFEGKKWNGSNPFSHTNSSGTSLVCSVKDGRILFYDRSSAENEGCTIYGLIDSIDRKLSNLVDSLDEEEFTKLSFKVFESLKIKSLDFLSDCHYFDEKGKRHLKDIIDILNEFIYPALKGEFYHYTNIIDNTASGETYYIYTPKGWYETHSFRNVVSILSRKFSELFCINTPSKILNSLNEKVIADLPAYLETTEPLMPCVYYQFFRNGYYDLRNNTLNPYTKEIFWYKDETLPYDYKQTTGSGIATLIEALKNSNLCFEDVQVLIHSFVLICQNQFFKTNKFLYLYGISTSGKSVFSNIIARGFNCSPHSASTVNTADTDYFGTYIKRITVLDEVVTIQKIISTIMQSIRNTHETGLEFRYRNLYQPFKYKIIPTSIILNGELLTLGRSDTGQQGQGNRIIPVEFNAVVDYPGNPYERFMTNPELIRDLVRWGVAQPFKSYKKRVQWLRSLKSNPNSKQSDRIQSLLTASDPFFDFLTHFEIDPDFDGTNFKDSHRFTPTDLVQYYESCTNDFETYKLKNRRASLAQKFTRSIRERFPLFTEKRVGKNKTTFYFGVIYNSINDYDQINDSELSE